MKSLRVACQRWLRVNNNEPDMKGNDVLLLGKGIEIGLLCSLLSVKCSWNAKRYCRSKAHIAWKVQSISSRLERSIGLL